MPDTRIAPESGRRNECPLCSSTSFAGLPFRYSFGGRYLYGTRCRVCSLVFISPRPSDDEISQLYSEEYFTECSADCGAHGREAYMQAAARGAPERQRFAQTLDALFLRYTPSRGALLEVGSGPGFLLDEFRKLGWNVRGLEISEYAARFGRENLGIPVEVLPIGRDSAPEASIDVVYMGDVLEHLPEPLVAMSAVNSWLRPGGIVVIAVPSTLNLVSGRLGMLAYRILRRCKTMRIPPYHLIEYTPATLRRLLAETGFKTICLRQSAVPLRKMGLRGSRIENAGKVLLQTTAIITSRVLNRGGDRLLAAARKL